MSSMASSTSTHTVTWRSALICWGAIMVALIGLNLDTGRDMVDIWGRNGTFTHAFLVVPISLWLVWRLKDALIEFKPSPNYWMLLPFAACALMSLLGGLSAINAASHWALVLGLIVSVPAVFGVEIARAIAFPLGFLLFCVPFGEFAMPTLMQWTANVTAGAVRASGIPVYQEGLQFVIPTGRWSVVEACSGVRYLIASFCIGVLFAYLNYASIKRRLLFVLASLLTPVLANWVRAYGIVMIGHLSGNELATGVDHLVYGWVFFGVVIFGLFFIGMRWQQDVPMPRPIASSEGLASNPSDFRNAGIALLAVLAIPNVVLMATASSIRTDVPAIQIAGDVAGQATPIAPFTSWSPDYVEPSAHFHQAYGQGANQFGIHVLYYRNQDKQRKLISASNVLVAAENKHWAQISQASQTVPTEKGAIIVNTATLRGGDLALLNQPRLRVWQFYWVDGHLTQSALKGKLLAAWQRLRGHGDDAASLIIYTSATEDADTRLSAILDKAMPVIQQSLQTTAVQGK